MKVSLKVILTVWVIFFSIAGACFGQTAAKKHLTKGVELAARGDFKHARIEFKAALKADPFLNHADRYMKIIEDAEHQKAEAKLMRAGADHVIQPERIGGFYMATMVKKPDVGLANRT